MKERTQTGGQATSRAFYHASVSGSLFYAPFFSVLMGSRV